MKAWTKKNLPRKLAWNANRRAKLLSSTPIYANLKKIEQIYIDASIITKETGIPHEVDHIIPLQGELVSGLHHENNLQIITAHENRAKSNKYKII